MRTLKIILWLFVINLGITFGAGLYEALVEFPHWLVKTADGLVWSAEAARNTDSGMKFWAFVSTGPLTLLTLASLFFAWKSKGELRKWWMVASCIVLVERLFTFTFFIPNMIALMDMPSNAESVAKAVRWGNFNVVRHVLNMGGWLAALKAFAIAHR